MLALRLSCLGAELVRETCAPRPEASRLKLPLGEAATFSYDAAGRLARQVLPNGQTYEYEHDQLEC